MKNRPLLLGVIIVISAGVYVRTFWAGFIFDDFYLVLNNVWLTDLKYIPDILTSPTWAFDDGSFSGGSSNYYRPVMHLVNFIGYQLFAASPYGYHIIDTLVHTLNSLLVFFIASILLAPKEGEGDEESSAYLLFSALAALIFATHPVNVEPVAWISSISETSLAFFFLLSFYLYLLYRKCAEKAVSTDRSVFIPYTLSVIMYAMALISKETAIVLPVLFISYDFPFKRPLSLIKRYLPYLAVALIYLYIRSLIVGSEDAMHGSGGYQYIETVIYLTGQYLEKLLLPINLKAYYFYHPIDSLISLSFMQVFSMLGIILLFALSIYLGWSRKKPLSISLMLIALPLLPPILGFNFIHGERLVSERYLYISSVGFALLVSYALLCLYENPVRGIFSDIKQRAVLITVLAVSLLLIYSAVTIKRTALWADEYTYWSEAVRHAPESAVTHANLGVAYVDKEMYDEALSEYKIALEIESNWDSLYMNVGSLYYNMNKPVKALEMFNQALSITTNESVKGKTYSRIGRIYFEAGDWASAILNYEEALVLSDRSNAGLYYKLGIAYGNEGSLEASLKAFQRVLEVEAGHSGAREKIGELRSILDRAD